jgi:hypothetical protein
MKRTTLGLAVAMAAFGGMSQSALAAGFIEDSTARIDLRNFYTQYDYRDAHTPTAEEWGQAFMLYAQSGFTEGSVGFGVDATYTLGIKLDADNDAGRQIFPADSDGSAVDDFSRGGLTGKMRAGKTVAQYGILAPKLPILVANNGRMLPQLFQGGMVTSNDIDGLTLVGGQLEKVVGRMSSNFTGLAAAGGTQDSNKFLFAGGDYKGIKDLTLQYYFANLEDYYKQHFLGALHSLPVGPGVLKTDLRYFNTSSDGKNADGAAGYLVSTNGSGNDGELDNNLWSAMFTYGLSGHAFSLGYQQVSEDSIFTQINQGSVLNGDGRSEGAGGTSTYVITDSLVNSLTYAGERTVMGRYAYDFAAAGVPGLTASLTYLKGDNIKTAGGSDREEQERDIMVTYTVQDGAAKGLGLNWFYGSMRSDVMGDVDHHRVFVTYSLPIW